MLRRQIDTDTFLRVRFTITEGRKEGGQMFHCKPFQALKWRSENISRLVHHTQCFTNELKHITFSSKYYCKDNDAIYNFKIGYLPTYIYKDVA